MQDRTVQGTSSIESSISIAKVRDYWGCSGLCFSAGAFQSRANGILVCQALELIPLHTGKFGVRGAFQDLYPFNPRETRSGPDLPAILGLHHQHSGHTSLHLPASTPYS